MDIVIDQCGHNLCIYRSPEAASATQRSEPRVTTRCGNERSDNYWLCLFVTQLPLLDLFADKQNKISIFCKSELPSNWRGDFGEVSMKGEANHQRPSQSRTRNGIRVNVYLHEDADEILNLLASAKGRSRTEVLEQAIFDTWFLFQASQRGEKVLLFDAEGDPPYREVVLDVRHAVTR